MNEADLKRALKKTVERELVSSVVFSHWDRVNVVPDLSVTWNGHTIWLELKKVVNGKIIDRKIQRRMMTRLWESGHNAWYILYSEFNYERDTYVVSPDKLDSYMQDYAMKSVNFDHHVVIDHLRRLP